MTSTFTEAGAPPLVSAANPRRRGVLSGRVSQTPKPRLVDLEPQVDGRREGETDGGAAEGLAAPHYSACRLWGNRHSKSRSCRSSATRADRPDNAIWRELASLMCGVMVFQAYLGEVRRDASGALEYENRRSSITPACPQVRRYRLRQ
jgi:hypothetical protein